MLVRVERTLEVADPRFEHGGIERIARRKPEHVERALRHGALVVIVRAQIANDSPQPQPFFSFGFWNLKPWLMSLTS